MSFREPNGTVMTNMKPKDGASIDAPSLRGLQGRSATGLNGQAAKDEVSAVWQGGWMPDNISGIPAGRSIFHLTSPLIGLLRPGQVESLHPQSRRVTCRRSPEVSSTAFDAQPPDLPPVGLMDMGFAILGSLARHPRPRIRFLFLGSRLCSTLLSGPASRRVLFHPCASL